MVQEVKETRSTNVKGVCKTESEVKLLLRQEFLGRSEEDYKAMWEEFQRQRENEDGGVVPDLNHRDQFRYWYATEQSTNAWPSDSLLVVGSRLG